MDRTVRQIGSVVVEQMRAAGYAESTIGQYKKTIKVLAGFVEARGGVYSKELGAAFESMTVSPAPAVSAPSAGSTTAGW